MGPDELEESKCKLINGFGAAFRAIWALL